MRLVPGREPIARLGFRRSVRARAVPRHRRGPGRPRAVRGRGARAAWHPAAAAAAAAERMADAPAKAPRQAGEAVPARGVNGRELLGAERQPLLELADLALVASVALAPALIALLQRGRAHRPALGVLRQPLEQGLQLRSVLLVIRDPGLEGLDLRAEPVRLLAVPVQLPGVRPNLAQLVALLLHEAVLGPQPPLGRAHRLPPQRFTDAGARRVRGPRDAGVAVDEDDRVDREAGREDVQEAAQV